MISRLTGQTAHWYDSLIYHRRHEWLDAAKALVFLLGGLMLLRILPEMAYHHLPTELYQRSWLGLAAFTELPVLAALGLALVLAAMPRTVSWQAVDAGKLPQLLVLCAGIPLTWAMTTYHPNFYLDQLHAMDRLLAILFLVGSVAHPCFLPLLLTQLYLIMGQFGVPLIDANIDKQLAYEIITLAMVPPVLRIGRIRIRQSDLLLATLVVIGAFYLKPGLGKVMLNWATWDQPAHLFPNAVFQNGWLHWISPSLRADIYSFLVATAGPMKLMTLVSELGVLLFAFHRRSAIALLLACTALHVGIFVSCGVCFWKWIVIDLAVAGYIWQMDRRAQQASFTFPRAVLASAAMVALMPIYKAPVCLAWYDTPITSRYDIEFVGRSGQGYQVPPYRLAPFDLSFAQGRLFLADPRPKLVDCMGGVSDLQLCQDLHRVTDGEQLEAMFEKYGDLQTDPARGRQLQLLLRRYIAAGPTPELALGLIPRAPQHIWTDRVDDRPVFDWQEPIETIRLRRADGLVIDGICQGLQQSLVFTIDGPSEAPTQIASESPSTDVGYRRQPF